MNITITYLPQNAHDQVYLHAWDNDGSVFHQKGERSIDGKQFRFVLTGNTADQREVAFKFRYPTESIQWESDDYVRTVPTTSTNVLWVFDFTARCLQQAPGAPSIAALLTFHVITQQRYKGGQIFVWPLENNQIKGERFPETTRNDAETTSTFIMPVRDWMKNGFYFKLVGGHDNFSDFEPESSNRVWLPSDGTEVWVKSWQIDLRTQPIKPISVPIEFIHSQTLAAPQLILDDLVDKYQATLNPTATSPFSADFLRSEYQVEVFEEALYTLRWASELHSNARRFRILQSSAAQPSITISSYGQWLSALPLAQDIQVTVVVHANPQSAFDTVINLEVGVSDAEPYKTIIATKQADGKWQTQLFVFPDIPFWVSIVGEARPDGPFTSRRGFIPKSSNLTLHTIDGVAGLANNYSNPFQSDAPLALRRQLMESAFDPAIVAAGVFQPWEMPHGATSLASDIYFVLAAPYSINSSLLLLPVPNAAGSPRVVQQITMSLTADLRYWWCKVPQAQVPHGTYYRFLLSDGQEVLDPASRWALDQGHLIVTAGSGAEESWSRYVDVGKLQSTFTNSSWKTAGWENLLIYELHPSRFTQRNTQSGKPLEAFDQLVKELATNGYLDQLPVTAIELLPVHEFPGEQGWGYNPSLFFGVDSYYGGPEGLARFVRASHDSKKAVLLDLVFNHLMESPLQW